MFSWVELLLAKTLTAVAAKPIAATMTKTASSAGYELGLLAAAGKLTIIPVAIVIYFVRNYIARHFTILQHWHLALDLLAARIAHRLDLHPAKIFLQPGLAYSLSLLVGWICSWIFVT